MSISTTSLDSLPMGDSNENITIKTEEKNVVIDNKMQELQQQRDAEINQKPSRTPSMDVNEFVSGLQKATSSGMTQLPSRDIPIDQNAVLKDEQVKPNFVPEGSQQIILQNIKQVRKL